MRSKLLTALSIEIYSCEFACDLYNQMGVEQYVKAVDLFGKALERTIHSREKIA